MACERAGGPCPATSTLTRVWRTRVWRPWAGVSPTGARRWASSRCSWPRRSASRNRRWSTATAANRASLWRCLCNWPARPASAWKSRSAQMSGARLQARAYTEAATITRTTHPPTQGHAMRHRPSARLHAGQPTVTGAIAAATKSPRRARAFNIARRLNYLLPPLMPFDHPCGWRLDSRSPCYSKPGGRR